jgi:hypothetical protein
MPQLELIDETWIAAPPAAVASLIADSARWADWWPDAPLEVREDRGPEGIRWAIAAGGEVEGSVEIWLQAVRDGVVLHYFVRADHLPTPWPRRRLNRERIRLQRRAKRVFWAVKDEREAGARADRGG